MGGALTVYQALWLSRGRPDSCPHAAYGLENKQVSVHGVKEDIRGYEFKSTLVCWPWRDSITVL